MLARLDERAREAVVRAQEEARALRHPAMGGEHLLLALAAELPTVVQREVAELREQVIAVYGTGAAPSPKWIPIAPPASEAIARAGEEAQDRAGPAHLLCALLRVDDRARTVLEAAGVPAAEAVSRAEAAVRELPPPVPADALEALRAGHPVPVTLGAGLPVGDIGNPRTDARLLRALLVADGPAAALLRRHGVDEAAVRDLAGDD